MNQRESTPSSAQVFDLTMRGLEAALKVGDIATYGLLTCKADDDAAVVMARDDLAPFECIPVRDEDHIIGVLERTDQTLVGTARSAMRALDDTLLVAADEPLKGFIPLLVQAPHLLVVRGTRIDGIVTRSDVHKLPVRLLAFALVTHLEMTMGASIKRNSQDDDWLSFLGGGRQGLIREKSKRLRRETFDPPLLELAEFCDKRDVLAKKGLLGPSKSKAIRELKRIEKLRNRIVHAAEYAQDHERFSDFVDLLALAEVWIGRLSAGGRRRNRYE